MSETPKFTVIDRRKIKAEEETDSAPAQPSTSPVNEDAAPAAPAEQHPSPGPQLVVDHAPEEPASETAGDLPRAPTAQESHKQKEAYDASAQRLDDLLRAQNPAAGSQPPVTFEHVIQQFYVSAMIQMGAGTQEGQRPRVDIVGARTTIDLLGVLAEKTRGNLTSSEDNMLQSVLFELRMAFLELTSMISMQPPPPEKP